MKITYTIELVAFAPMTSMLFKTALDSMHRSGYPFDLNTTSAPPSLYLVDGENRPACDAWLEKNKNGLNAPVLFIGTNPYTLNALLLKKPLRLATLCEALKRGFHQKIPVIDESFVKSAVLKKKVRRVEHRSHNENTILIVDDSSTIRNYIALKLSAFAVVTEQVASGEEAIVLLEKQKYKSVFLDVVMPGMDGYETCKTIRKRLNLDVPVIMITVLDSKFDKMRGIASGCTDYLCKPIDDYIFRQTMQKLGIQPVHL